MKVAQRDHVTIEFEYMKKTKLYRFKLFLNYKMVCSSTEYEDMDKCKHDLTRLWNAITNHRKLAFEGHEEK